MIIPAVMLAILAIVAIRALMAVVAHEDVSAPIHLATGTAIEPTSAQRVWADDARSFLLPAAGDHIDLEQSGLDANAS